MNVELHACGALERYDDVVVVILFFIGITRHRCKRVMCQHKAQYTWERPGGHVEMGESAPDAADRELREEAGAWDFALEPLLDCRVERNGVTSNGQVSLARVAGLRAIPEGS